MRLTKWQQLQQARTNRTYWKWKWKREELVGSHTQLSSTHLFHPKKKRVGVAVQKRRQAAARVRHMMCAASRRIVYVEAINGS